MRTTVLPLACAVLGLSCLATIPAAAQNRPLVNPMQREPARGAGTIKGPAMGGMEVVAGGGERYVVQLEPQARQIEYVGSAELSWLHPGLLVRFSTVVDKRYRMTEPVSHFDVITMRDGYQLGLVTDSGGSNNNEGGGLFQDPKPEKAEKPAKKAPVPESTPVTIIGRLGEVKNGKFQVSIPGKTLKGEIAEGAKVSIDYGNLSLVRPGDKIDFQGWSPVGMKQLVYASSVTVTASEKLVGETKKKPRVEDKDDEKPGLEKPDDKKGDDTKPDDKKPDGKKGDAKDTEKKDS